jgi:hypothetical protein
MVKRLDLEDRSRKKDERSLALHNLEYDGMTRVGIIPWVWIYYLSITTIIWSTLYTLTSLLRRHTRAQGPIPCIVRLVLHRSSFSFMSLSTISSSSYRIQQKYLRPCTETCHYCSQIPALNAKTCPRLCNLSDYLETLVAFGRY